MDIDPILALETFGYTEREASFLYLVARHSGYFLRRQFDAFIQREHGGISHRFVEKARIAGHIAVIDYQQGQHVYHLFHRPIYRLLGDDESQNRRRKGDDSVRARLMTLDYILENKQEHYLETLDDKLRFFIERRRVSEYCLRGLDDFLTAYPIAVADMDRPMHSPLRFLFVDAGALTSVKFARYLESMRPLLASVGDFELIYVATSKLIFHEAARLFYREFPRKTNEAQSLFSECNDDSSRQKMTESRRVFVTYQLGYSYPKLLRSDCQESARRTGERSKLLAVIRRKPSTWPGVETGQGRGVGGSDPTLQVAADAGRSRPHE